MYLLLIAVGRGPEFGQTLIPSSQGCFVPGLVEVGSVAPRKKIFKYFKYNFTFLLVSPLGKGVALHMNKHKSPSSKMLCAMFGKNWPSGSGEKDF